MNDILFWVCALFAEIIGTMAGFGSSTIFLPIALFFFDFKTALVLVAMFHISGNVGRITFFRHGLNKELLLVFGLPSVALTLIGALMVKFVSQPILKLILGLFLIFYVLLSIYKPDLEVKSSTRNSIVGGGLSGFFAGLIGTGGALRGAFLTSFNLKKSVYVATAAAISLAVDITRIPVYLGSGFLSQEYYYFVPFLFMTAIIGSFIGKRIVTKIPQKSFRRFVLVCIGLASLRFVYDGIVLFL